MGPEGNDPRLLAPCLNTILPLSGATHIQTEYPLLNLSDRGERLRQDATARLWDVDTRDKGLTHVLEHQSEVSSASFSPDGRTVLAASHDGTARLWDTDTGTERCPEVFCRSLPPEPFRLQTIGRR
jgi:WD40 repeat protein